MLVLKSFFRKKSTKIYLIIYSIIIATIICSITLIKYNKDTLNEITKKRSYLSVLNSPIDYYSEILNYKNISEVERIILFEIDDECKVFKHSSYSVINKDGTMIEYNTDDDENKPNWEDYIEDKNFIHIMSDNELELKDNEIALSTKGVGYLDSKTVNNLIGQKISFLYNDEKVEFTIKEFYDSENAEMKISKNKFNELLNNDTYSYKIYLEDYEKAREMAEKLETINDNIEVCIHYRYSSEDNDDSVRNLINIFEAVSLIAITIFVFIFIIVSKNILDDEIKNKEVQRMLGYNKMQTIKYSALKILSLCVISVIIAIIISIIAIVIINMKFDFKIKI